MDVVSNDETPHIENKVKYYVGVGASAGGLEALELLFSNMPRTSGIAFIVIQHLSPDYKSLMVELLSKRTEMIVKRAEDGIVVEPDCIYLIPPKKNLSIFHGKLILRDSDHSKGINLPIDIFLRSLAEDQGEKSIGIILSGTGSDGVRGIRSIKEAGGLVIAQSEDTAKFDGMPRATISTGLTDFILAPEEIPQKLMNLVKHPYSTKTERPQAFLSDEDGLTRVFSLLRERTKVDFTFYKPSTVLRRIERRMTVNQIEQLNEYVRLLESHSGEIVILFRELLIGVTCFFRDKEVFDEIYETYLPIIISNPQNRELRFWIAGCSTGEEAYTIAMISREIMEQSGQVCDLKIFATDIDRDAIMNASAGLYSESITADLPPKYLSKYFVKRDDKYQIARSIREMVVFAQHNLAKDPPFTNIDLISCRNLLIYLQPILQRKVMELFNFSLKPQGILLLGTSETTGEMGDLFEAVHNKFKIYKSRGKKHHTINNADFPVLPDVRPISRRLYGSSSVLKGQEEERLLDRIIQSVAEDYITAAIVVNEQMEILHILGDTSGYFKLPIGKLTNDITKMASKELAIPISTGLQKVFHAGNELKYSNIRATLNAEIKNVDLRMKMLPSKKGHLKIAIVYIEESTAPTVPQQKEAATVYDVSLEAEQRIHDLEQELQFTRENLQATIEELETANEELQATNEELLASNEELQSTNEELQSVNEELHTVNSEYQSKIIELTELNNDLDNLLSSTQIGTLFLDENLEIRKFTPEIQKIFKILLNDIGRPVNHLTHMMKNVDIWRVIKEVELNHKPIELEVEADDGNWYFLRVLPYQIGNNTYSGVVLTFINITKLKNIQNDLLGSENKLQSIYKTAPVGVGLVKERVVEEVNDKMCEFLGYSRSEIINRSTKHFYKNEEEFESVGKFIDGQISKHGIATFETEWIKKDGTSIQILLSVAPLEFADSSKGNIFTMLDLSLRNEAIDKALKIEREYKLLFDTMAEGVVYQNRDGEIISANNAAFELLGLTLDQMLGRTSIDPRWKAIKIDGSEFNGEVHPAMIALKSGRPVLGQTMGVFNPKTESIRWININSIPLFKEGESTPHQVYSTFDDITQTISDAKYIIDINKRLDSALKISDLIWWDWNIETNKVIAGNLKSELIGYSEIKGEQDLEFWTSKVHPDDYEKTMNAMRDHLSGQKDLYECKYRIKCKDGSWKTFHDKGKIVERDKNDKPTRVIGTVNLINR